MNATSQELVPYEQLSEELTQGAIQHVDQGDLVVPLLKVCQPLTGEVESGEAHSGDLLNSLTGENHGTDIEFFVAGFNKGRFKADRDTGETIVGPFNGVCDCHAVSYPDCPDAEEQYRYAVNRGEHEWGKGPKISTTYNFTGFIVGAESPVRLSLMRAAAKPAKRWLTMIGLNRAPWDSTFKIETQGATSRKGHKFQAVSIKQGRATTPEERQQAVNLAQAIQRGATVNVGDEAEAAGAEPAREETTGGIDY